MINNLYNEKAANKLVRMAVDAGICFTNEDIYLNLIEELDEIIR